MYSKSVIMRVIPVLKHTLRIYGNVKKLYAILNVAISCDIALCSLYVNQQFRGTYHPHLQGQNSAEQEISLQQVVMHSSETSIHVWTTRHSIPEDGKICNYYCENLKSYLMLVCCLSYSLTLKMERVHSSEVMVDFYKLYNITFP
jgi:hypothetical protein